MLRQPVSELFDRGGLLLSPARPDETTDDLNTGEIVELFERHGVLVFRGFTQSDADVSQLTDRFTEAYAPDALRRRTRFNRKMIRDVDYGHNALPLHSEASFAAAWPELLWFYCVTAPGTGGCTTLCDGARLWRTLPAATRAMFVEEPLKYDVAVPVGVNESETGVEPWPATTPGVSGHINWAKGIIELCVLRYAAHPTRNGDALAFANHLLASEPQIRDVRMAGGRRIDADVVAEIRATADRVTFDLQWQARDLVMIDNHRFMHGRRAYDLGVKRDIVQIQSQRASFAYGATIRTARADRLAV